MSEAGSNSLIRAARDQAAAQGALFPVPADDIVRECPGLRDRPQYTAEAFSRRRPADYARAVALLADGARVFDVARIFGVSPNTIYSIRRREAEEVERLKAAAADQARDLSHAAWEAAGERLADPEKRASIPFRDLILAGAITSDKAELLSGGATSRVEIRAANDDGLAALVAEAETIHLSARADGQKGEVWATGEDPAAGTGDGAEEAPLDMVSGGDIHKSLPCNACAAPVSDNVPDNSPGAGAVVRADAGARGGEGVRGETGGAITMDVMGLTEIQPKEVGK